MVTRFFLDTEFTQLPWHPPSQLLWVALVDETGTREFSAVNTDCPHDEVSPFVREHVLPRISTATPLLTARELAYAIEAFVARAPEFWAWFPSIDDVRTLAGTARAEQLHRTFADWDYQLLRGLYHRPPASWPQRCRDVHSLADEAGVGFPNNPNPHDPLSDAHWARRVWLRARSSRADGGG